MDLRAAVTSSIVHLTSPEAVILWLTMEIAAGPSEVSLSFWSSTWLAATMLASLLNASMTWNAQRLIAKIRFTSIPFMSLSVMSASDKGNHFNLKYKHVTRRLPNYLLRRRRPTYLSNYNEQRYMINWQCSTSPHPSLFTIAQALTVLSIIVPALWKCQYVAEWLNIRLAVDTYT